MKFWGRGTIKIIKECKQAGIPEPVFSYHSSDISVEFRKDIYNEKYLCELGLNERQFDALLFFKQQRVIVTSEYIRRYDVVDRTARRDLVELVERGLLYREGEGKGSKYKFL